MRPWRRGRSPRPDETGAAFLGRGTAGRLVAVIRACGRFAFVLRERIGNALQVFVETLDVGMPWQVQYLEDALDCSLDLLLEIGSR